MNETFIWILNQLSFPWMPPHKPPSALVDEWKVLRFFDVEPRIKIMSQIRISNLHRQHNVGECDKPAPGAGILRLFSYGGGTHFHSLIFFRQKKRKKICFLIAQIFHDAILIIVIFREHSKELPMLRGRWSGAAGLRPVALALRVLCKTRKQLEMKRKFEKCLRKLDAYIQPKDAGRR